MARAWRLMLTGAVKTAPSGGLVRLMVGTVFTVRSIGICARTPATRLEAKIFIELMMD